MTQLKKRGLGRGLDALLGGVAPTPANSSVDVSSPASMPSVIDQTLRRLPVDVIQRGRYQPRNEINQDRLAELAESIRAQGIVQPIVVRPLATPGRYEIIAGERRWRAAQLAGLQDVPAVIRDVPDNAALAMALIENIQREDLNPLEEAMALQRLANEFSLTHQEVAEAVGRSRAAVSNLLRLLELTDDVKRLLETGAIEMGHARALLSLPNAMQSEAARRVVAKKLTVRETEQLVRQLVLQRSPKTSSPHTDPDVKRLQDDLSDKLGAKVTIHHGAKGKGTLTIAYNNLDELDGILGHIR